MSNWISAFLIYFNPDKLLRIRLIKLRSFKNRCRLNRKLSQLKREPSTRFSKVLEARSRLVIKATPTVTHAIMTRHVTSWEGRAWHVKTWWKQTARGLAGRCSWVGGQSVTRRRRDNRNSPVSFKATFISSLCGTAARRKRRSSVSDKK